MSSCWEGGWGSQSEDEREQSWVDPLDGRLPGETEADQEDRADSWKEPDWHDGPEYRLYRRKRDEEGN